MPEETDHNQTESRLRRIESKLDKLVETVVSIARAEEKLVHLERDQIILIKRVSDIEEKVEDVGKMSASNNAILTIASRMFWIAAGAAITFYIGLEFFGK
jgi:tetrahydromethanopterin S-methyltransferase subunit G